MSELEDYLMTKVLVVTPDGHARVKRLNARTETWSTEVGGVLEHLSLTPDVSCFINDDGKALGLPYNPVADLMIRTLLRSDGRQLTQGDHIVGPAVFLGATDRYGREGDVPEKVLDWVRTSPATVNDKVIVFHELEEE